MGPTAMDQAAAEDLEEAVQVEVEDPEEVVQVAVEDPVAVVQVAAEDQVAVEDQVVVEGQVAAEDQVAADLVDLVAASQMVVTQTMLAPLLMPTVRRNETERFY